PSPIPSPPHKMCTVTYNETKCSRCKTLIKSEVDRSTCYEVLTSQYTASPLIFGGCKARQTSVTNTKEDMGMCDVCKARKIDAADVWRAAALGAL
ncbi:hypothetical protein B0H65DRAFT_419679, partial [Neurospora tetraspora]